MASRGSRWRTVRWVGGPAGPAGPVGLLLLALLGPVAAPALEPGRGVLQYHRTLLGSADGLPNQIVVSLAPSRDGGLWVGTEGGLAWFDGHRFDVYDGRRDPALASDVLAYRALAEDGAGDLWLANLAGDLLRLDAVERRVTLVRPSDGDDPRGVWFAGGRVWMGTTRRLVEVREGEVHVLGADQGVPKGGVRTLAADAAGRIWVATDRGLRQVRDGRLEPVDPAVEAAIGGRPVSAATAAPGGGLWVAGLGWLLRTDGQGRLAERYEEGVGFPRAAPLVARVDAAGALWLGYAAGLARFQGGRLEGPYGARSGLGGEHVSSITEDREGNLWVGFWTGGLLRLRAGDARTFGQEEGLAALGVNALAEGPDGDVYLGTRAGLERLRGGKVEMVAAVDTPEWTCTAVAFDAAGTLYFGLGRFLYRLEAGRPRRVADAGSWILALAQDRAGTIWAGTEEGIWVLRGGALVHPDGGDAPLSAEAVAHLLVAGDGTLWAVGERSGPMRRAGDRFVPASSASLPRGSMYESLHVDDDGTLWQGTTSAGLWRLRGGTWTRYGPAQGLTESSVYGVLDDGVGHLWLTGNRGISRVARAELEEVADGRRAAVSPVVFGLDDGLRARECAGGMGHQVLRARDGHLWFATARGASVIDPRRERRPPPAPLAYLAAAAGDGRPLATGQAQRLGPGLERLQVEYGAVSLSSAQQLRFRYRLQGYDPGWIEAGETRVAQYTRLPPGRYRFEAQAMLVGGRWGSESGALEVEIQPHLWQRAWFAPSLLAAGLLALLAVHRLRIRRMAAAAQRLQAAVDRAVAEVQTLRGMLPVCAWCKKVRDDEGAWTQIESYVSANTYATFSHGMCPQCLEKMERQLDEEDGSPPDGSGGGAPP